MNRWTLLAALALLAVAVLHLTTVPRTIWEYDENLYAMGVERYEPLLHHPPPPGTPIYIGFAKLVPAEPFDALVITSILALFAGLFAFTCAFRELSGSLVVAVVGTVLLYASPTMLISGTVPQSDCGALALLGFAIWACARGNPTAIGIACAAAIGWRLQFSVAVVPLFLVAVVLLRSWRDRVIAVGAFGLGCLAWLIPQVLATGGPESWWHWLSKQASYYAAHDSDLSRSGVSAGQIALRFLAHPWGPKYLSMPILVLAAVGVALWWRIKQSPLPAAASPRWGEGQGEGSLLARGTTPHPALRATLSPLGAGRGDQESLTAPDRWRFAPLAVSSILYFAFALATMDPADAVRYAIPALPFIALFAAMALRRVPWLAIAYVAGAYAYAFPILHARATSDAPPAAAAKWIEQHVSRDTVILYDPALGPHVDNLLRGWKKTRVDVDPSIPVIVLADGERGDAAGVTFRWPDTDAYRKLTRQHYGAVSVIPLPTGQRYRVVEGVFAPERLRDGTSWRWLGARAVLDLPQLGAKSVKLVFHAPPEYPFESNRVRVGNSIVTLRPNGTAEVVVPFASRITIEPERSFVPAKVAGANNRDLRTLSVMLTKLEQQ